MICSASEPCLPVPHNPWGSTGAEALNRDKDDRSGPKILSNDDGVDPGTGGDRPFLMP